MHYLQILGPGDTETVCFEFIINPDWDLSKIHIVGMLMDSRMDITHVATIAAAETQGLSNSCSGATETIYLDGPDDLVYSLIQQVINFMLIIYQNKQKI